MRCPKCGAENLDNVDFCSLCLFAFKNEAEPPKNEINQLAEDQIDQNSSISEEKTSNPNYKIWKEIIKITLISLLIATPIWYTTNLAGRTVEKEADAQLLKIAGNVLGEDSKVNTKDKSITFTIEGQEFKINLNKSPDGWPEDFPMVKGAKIRLGGKTEVEEGNGYMTISISTKSKSEIIDFYNESLPEADYKVVDIKKDVITFSHVVPISSTTGKIDSQGIIGIRKFGKNQAILAAIFYPKEPQEVNLQTN